MNALPARFEISADEIDTQVRVFYAAIRRHAILGPVFGHHIADWPEHEAKISYFWRGAILHERGYEGSPMIAHRSAEDVEAEHFPLWLDLFDEILLRTQKSETAAAWSHLARRIGRSLRMGVEQARQPAGSVPVF